MKKLLLIISLFSFYSNSTLKATSLNNNIILHLSDAMTNSTLKKETSLLIYDIFFNFWARVLDRTDLNESESQLYKIYVTDNNLTIIEFEELIGSLLFDILDYNNPETSFTGETANFLSNHSLPAMSSESS